MSFADTTKVGERLAQRVSDRDVTLEEVLFLVPKRERSVPKLLAFKPTYWSFLKVKKRTKQLEQAGTSAQPVIVDEEQGSPELQELRNQERIPIGLVSSSSEDTEELMDALKLALSLPKKGQAAGAKPTAAVPSGKGKDKEGTSQKRPASSPPKDLSQKKGRRNPPGDSRVQVKESEKSKGVAKSPPPPPTDPKKIWSPSITRADGHPILVTDSLRTEPALVKALIQPLLLPKDTPTAGNLAEYNKCKEETAYHTMRVSYTSVVVCICFAPKLTVVFFCLLETGAATANSLRRVRTRLPRGVQDEKPRSKEASRDHPKAGG